MNEKPILGQANRPLTTGYGVFVPYRRLTPIAGMLAQLQNEACGAGPNNPRHQAKLIRP